MKRGENSTKNVDWNQRSDSSRIPVPNRLPVSIREKLHESRLLAECMLRMNEQRESSALKIQAFWRGYQCRKNYLKLRSIAQNQFRTNRSHQWTPVVREKVGLKAEQLMKSRIPVSLENCDDMEKHFQRRKAVLKRKICRELYDQVIHESVIKIQNWFRAIRVMRVQREWYLKLKSAVITVQKRFRANQVMKVRKERRERIERYQKLKSAVITVQKRFRANRLMRQQKERYELIRRSVVVIQRFHRKTQLNKKAKNALIGRQVATIRDKWFRNRQKIFRTLFCVVVVIIISNKWL